METEENGMVHSSFWSNLFTTSSKKEALLNSISSIRIFKDLNSKEISQLKKVIHTRTYLAGEYIFNQGDPGIGIYFIQEGEVVIKRSVDPVENILLASFKKGDFFGELALIDGEKRSASAIAKTDVVLSVIFKPELDEFNERFPRKGIKISQQIAEIVVTRLRKLNEENVLLQTMLKIKSEKDYGT
jgi:CRP-like cAMP-binding protein